MAARCSIKISGLRTLLLVGRPRSKAQRGKLHPPEILVKWLDELRKLEAEESHHSSQRRGALAQAEVALFSGLRAEEMERLTVEWLEQAAPEVKARTGYTWMIRLPEDSMRYDTPLLARNHRRAYRNAVVSCPACGARIWLIDQLSTPRCSVFARTERGSTPSNPSSRRVFRGLRTEAVSIFWPN